MRPAVSAGATKSAAVLRVIGERPGVTASDLAAASRVTGGTLYTLLRRLTQEGTRTKRERPGGQSGYALAASVTSGADGAATERTAPTIKPSIDAEPARASQAHEG